MKKIIDSYINVSDTDINIFQRIFTEKPVAWLGVVDYVALNFDYIFNHSGDKYISPYVERIREKMGNDNQALNQLAETIARRFVDRWDKMHTALLTDYKPLENYSMEEIRTPNLQKVINNNLSESLTMQKGSKSKTSIEQDQNITSEQSTKVKPFNDIDLVEVSNVDGSTDQTQDHTKNYSETELSGSDIDTKLNTGSVTESNTGNEKLTRSGNIGVTTSQQMLESELELRAKYDMVEIMLNDIDTILALSIY